MTAQNKAEQLVMGANADPGLVAVEPLNSDARDEMILYSRKGSKITVTKEPFRPFLWLEKGSLLKAFEGGHEVVKLAGSGPLNHLASFRSWKDLQAALKHLKQETGFTPSVSSAPFFCITDPVEQHLMTTGRTLFKDMAFEALGRMQVDIETYVTRGYDFPNAARPGDRIIAIALADQSGWVEVLSGDEAAMLKQFVELVQERDPDVIEGHNIFKFDLPYLEARARRHKIKLKLGRDGGLLGKRPSRFVTADRTINYPKYSIHGRHVADTLFMVQAYDVARRSLDSYGLKDVARHFELVEEDRTYIPGEEIAATFDRDPEKVMAYARDDILETRRLGDLLSPVYFTQAQMLPMTYQNICVRGSAGKIDGLILREYLRQGHAIGKPDSPREFAGGYTDIFFEGIAKNVHHCDVRSLYPSLTLVRELAPASDELGVYLKLLRHLLEFRVEAKEQMQKTEEAGRRRHLDALQGAYKILINSFYGYLGFSQARFSDFDAAEKVAAEGRKILEGMIAWLRENGGTPVEIDTDGIYFVPPEVKSKAEMERFRTAFQKSLPRGISLEFDGEYKSMFSYKMKNYALLAEDGEMVIKGAALKSRGLEPFQRSFLEEFLRLRLEGRDGDIPELKRRYEQDILHGRWPVRMLAKTETLQESPAGYAAKIDAKGRGRNAAYELALKSGREYQAGDQISYYVTGSKKSVQVFAAAKLVSEWNPESRDENIPYYLAKLGALCKKFGI